MGFIYYCDDQPQISANYFWDDKPGLEGTGNHTIAEQKNRRFPGRNGGLEPLNNFVRNDQVFAD